MLFFHHHHHIIIIIIIIIIVFFRCISFSSFLSLSSTLSFVEFSTLCM